MVALLPLTCLCIPGSMLLALVTLAMSYALFKSWRQLGADHVFTSAFIGVVFLTVAQFAHTLHAVYHIFQPIMYSPSLRTMVASFELFGYVMLFWATQKYFRRFGDIE
ncbi:MAG: hypothetical protein ABEJ75_00165 [Candidatus Nanohaloarchaea archaeon]